MIHFKELIMARQRSLISFQRWFIQWIFLLQGKAIFHLYFLSEHACHKPLLKIVLTSYLLHSSPLSSP